MANFVLKLSFMFWYANHSAGVWNLHPSFIPWLYLTGITILLCNIVLVTLRPFNFASHRICASGEAVESLEGATNFSREETCSPLVHASQVKQKNFQGLLCLLRRCYLASCNLILMPGIVKLFVRYTYIHFFRLLSKISFCLIFQGTKAGVVPTSRKPCPRLIY